MHLDRVVLVTGASAGIGEACARRFARDGWTTVLAARSEDRLTRVAREIEQSGGRVLSVPTDVAVPDQRHHLIDTVAERLGRIDVLVNNAGRGHFGRVEDLDLQELEDTFRLNLFAPIAMIQDVLPLMRRQGEGTVLNISSIIEDFSPPLVGVYGSSKAALGYISDVARIELAQHGIAVVNVIAGATTTEFESNALHNERLGGLLGGAMQRGVSSERVAETVYRAVRRKPRRTYVRRAEWIMGAALRPIPGLICRIFTFLLGRSRLSGPRR